MASIVRSKTGQHLLTRFVNSPIPIGHRFTRSLETLAFEEVRSPSDERPSKFTAFVLHGLLGSGRNWRSFSRTLASTFSTSSPPSGILLGPFESTVVCMRDVEARMRSELEAFGERFQRTVASLVKLIFNRLDDLEVDSGLTVLEWKVDVFAEEIDDLIEERVAHFTKLEVQRHKDLKGQVTELQEELAACKKELTRAMRQECIAMQPRQKKMLEPRSYDGAREARQKGSIREYVKEYSTLNLEILEMSERQRLCFFVDGLQQWTATVLRRNKPHDLASAMAIVKRLEDFEQCERPRSPRHKRAKGGGDGRSKSGSPKATDDERNEDEGRCHHHKGEKKHARSRKQSDSRDHKTHVGLRRECFYCAGPHCGRYCPHNGKMIAFLEKHKGSNEDSSSSDGEARMGTLQMVNAFVQKSKEEAAKEKKSKKR
ncbi:hypothetical protein RJ639_035271 [Escallonia herrerae]|uniref:Retrotransposon gag domain-containing protein n=1 Tax=Escallonia herrerae TaxID=1293975 RepID=A0AA88WUV3_9ASTE|nr:hypothetical protein RJ639_035271 [Escallonia herrerae]